MRESQNADGGTNLNCVFKRPEGGSHGGIWRKTPQAESQVQSPEAGLTVVLKGELGSHCC